MKVLAGTEQITDLLKRHGLDDDSVIDKYLCPLMKANETKFFAHEGMVVDSREVKAWGPRARGLEIFSAIRGWNKSEQENTTQWPKAIIINVNSRPPRAEVQKPLEIPGITPP